MKFTMKLLFTTAIVLGMGVSAYGNLLLNPSFEDGTGQGGHIDDADIDNWTAWGGDGWWADNEVHDGDWSIRRWSPGLGIYQDVFDITPGGTYEASAWFFDDSGEPMDGDAYFELRLEWRDNDTTLSTDVIGTFNGGGTLDQWTEVSGFGTAHQDAEYVRFVISTEGTGDPWGRGTFDSATLIPEPGTMAMLLLGGLGLVWARRRRVS